jgi:hypothetical protein
MRRFPAVLLLLTAVVTGLSHVCGELAHGDGGHHDHAAATPAPAADHGSDSLHAASCDAVGGRAVSVPPAVVASILAPAGFQIAPGADGRPAPGPERPTGTSPPIFLLHAALLI